MSVCHQAHNIPWSILQEHVRIEGPNPAFPQRRCTDFFGRDLPTQEKATKHFAKKLGDTIREFAKTERAKYDERIEMDELKALPDDMNGLHIGLGTHEAIRAEQQTVSWWRAEAPNFGQSSNAFFPAAIRELIFRDHVPNLLFLAQKLGADLLRLRWVTYSHFFHFGTNRAYQDALVLYIVINVYLMFDLYGPSPARPRPASPSERDSAWPHALTRARDLANGSLDCSDAVTNISTAFWENGNDYLQDTARIKGFLKILFRVLYVSDMYIRECGGEIEWEDDVRQVLEYGLNIKLEYQA